ncbi:MAG: methyltransferase family protein [Planctomycetota bacterium]|jgi:protein-S-isoprenylcysteine O-methyltransferase Ste14
MKLLLAYLLLALPLTAWGLWKARGDYRRHGKLTGFGLISLCTAFLMPHLALDAAVRYEWPRTGLDFVGVGVGVAGAALCLWALVAFRSAAKVFCLDAGRLTATGPYRWSRNPQYVGWGLILLGFALNGWTPWCLAALGLFAVVVHLLVLLEEEHLARVFGESYRAFCRTTARYLGRRA